MVIWKAPVSPRGAVKAQNSLKSCQTGVAAARGCGARRSPFRTSHMSHAMLASRPRANGIEKAAAIDDGRVVKVSARATSRNCRNDLPMRSMSAFGIIVPNPRVAATATV